MSDPKTPTGASNNAGQTRRGRPFEPGNRAGRGRKAGSRNKASLLLDQIADKEAEDILRKVIDAAKGGDTRSAEVILSRIWPPRKGRAVRLDLPAIDTPADIVKALGIVAGAVGAGDITPEEGSAVAAVLEFKRKSIETVDFEQRLSALEKERSK